MDAAFVSRNCTPPKGRIVVSGGRLFPMPEEPEGKLLARIAVFKQDNEIACICCTDQKIFMNHVVDQIRSRISAECGIPVTNIMLVASHTHSVPDLVPVPLGVKASELSEFSFVDEYTQHLIEGIREAKSKLSPIYYWKANTVPIEIMGICRRPIFQLDDTAQVATQAPRNSDDFAGLDGRDEDNLTAFAAFNNVQEPIGGFVNYACHPCTRYGTPFYTADYPGAFYESIDSQTPAVFLYANGPSGNVAHKLNGAEYCSHMGKVLSETALAAIKCNSTFPVNNLCCLHKTLEIPRRIPTEEQVKYAQEFLNNEPNENEIGNFATRMYGVKYHMSRASRLPLCRGLCRQLLTLHEEIQQGIDTEQVRLQVIAVSKNIAFIGVSAEIFNQFTDQIRQNSPFSHNCIMGLANGWNGYIPPAESYEMGGYECCLSQINRLDKQAFNQITEATLSMLNQVSANNN